MLLALGMLLLVVIVILRFYEQLLSAATALARPMFHSNGTKSGYRSNALYADDVEQNLLRRVAQLEHIVRDQNSQMAMLQTTTADLIRRLAAMETAQMAQSQVSAKSSRQMLSSQSSYSLAPSMRTRSPSRMSSSLYECDSSSTLSIATTASNAGRVNISVGRSPRGSPMRKWTSNVDVGRTNSDAALNRIPSRITSPSCSTSSRSSLVRTPTRRGRAPQPASIDEESGNMTVEIQGKVVKVPLSSKFQRSSSGEKTPAPSKKPSLEWIYGMRTRESRQSLVYSPTGEYVYFAGNVIVMWNPEDNQQRFYQQHTAEVKCLILHPNGSLIASGQGSLHGSGIAPEHRTPITSSGQLEQKLVEEQTQAHIRIWHVVTLSTTRVIGNHDFTFDRGIACMAFSQDGHFLAAIDQGLHHKLSVWEWQSERKVSDVKAANDITFGCAFHPNDSTLLLVYGKGYLTLWQLTEDDVLIKMPLEFKGRNKPKTVLSACFNGAGHLATGDSNGSITIWNISNGSIITQGHDIHKGGVFCLFLTKSLTLLSVGRGEVIESDGQDLSRRRKPLTLSEDLGLPRCIVDPPGSRIAISFSSNTVLHGNFDGGLKNLIYGSCGEAIYAKTFDENKLISISSNGNVTCWNKKSYDWSENFMETMAHWVGEQVTTCAAVSSNALLALGFTNGFVIWDITTKQVTYDASEENVNVTTISFSPNSSHLAFGMQDNFFRIYRLDSQRRPQLLTTVGPLPAAAKTLEWNVDGSHIRISTIGNHLLHYALSGTMASSTEIRDFEWSDPVCSLSQEAALGTHVMQDVNVVSCKDDILAFGRGSGKIRLYTSPVKCEEANYHDLQVCSNTVKSLAIASGQLYACCSGENAVFQWKLA